ncbi:PTS sugar transporter subunit IIC [Salinigranum rubrum]|uniref:PTS sugar transporter subunit IIC n=1 Tax=Salinigranum rubrum TaxID=755307 RepID=A0A2I8VL29_9EURY|nr:PTS fructose transporter subunit IIB [Salinigranum rubrum]AUV81789.1 PTS sugar transporter subunit IIC [Salinigranum rubrum]
MKIVAVTACPTGIAHSQMAAENLETTAEEMGHDIKVEVQGSMGAQNELTSEDIAEADVVIITADTSVQRDRFEGKPLVKKTVKDGVNDAKGVIQEAERLVEGEGSEADAGSESEPMADTGAESTGTTEEQEPTRRGGDREKGLFARLKRLFS